MSTLEDAYALMKENGYSGTMEDFEALCTKAAEEMGSMDMDAMDDVAGGFDMDSVKNTMVTAYETTIDALKTAWGATSDAFGKGLTWVKDNPALTAEIGGGVTVATIGITVGAKVISARNQRPESNYDPYADAAGGLLGND